MAYTIFMKHLRFNPKNPGWAGRDRFILSNGHASALLYSIMHLTGYDDLSLDELRNFRQLGSKTPGHPENHLTRGVEVSTGPLGQGLSNAVGMAIGEAHLAARFNREGLPPLFDGFVYVICGDGCHQEGITGEAASLAGHLQLGRLIVLYDDNKITIDGSTDLSFTEDVGKRYEAYGWQVLRVDDGDNDVAAIDAAIVEAKQELSKPSLIVVRTTIGYGSKKQATADVHGSPLALDDIASIKAKFGLDPSQSFHVPEQVRAHYAERVGRGAALEQAWNEVFDRYAAAHPDLAAELRRRLGGELPAELYERIAAIPVDTKNNSTRKMSSTTLNVIAPWLPELVGGSADLTPSTLTSLNCSHDFQPASRDGRYLRFGVREHAMCAVANGLAAYGGFIPFASTFLNFVGYALGAIRLSSLSHFRVIYVMTHDSIGLGEDGPTHQPVETLASLRAMPNHYVWRPANQFEVSAAYIAAIREQHAPSTLALTRQDLEPLPRSSVDDALRGGYIAYEPANPPQAVFVATGSEVSLAVKAALLLQDSLRVRVVSLPCWEVFQAQSLAYQQEILPALPTLSVEAAAVHGWERFAHAHIGMHTFGVSAPASVAFKHLGFTPEALAEKIQKLVNADRKSVV